HWMLTGFEGPAFNAPDFKTQRRPALGSASARLRPAPAGLPSYVAVPHLRGGTHNFFHYPPYLRPSAHPLITPSHPNLPPLPFTPAPPPPLPPFPARGLPPQQELDSRPLEGRREVLSALDPLSRNGDKPALNEHPRQAFGLLTSEAIPRAFDITAESPRLRDSY